LHGCTAIGTLAQGKGEIIFLTWIITYSSIMDMAGEVLTNIDGGTHNDREKTDGRAVPWL
jgi:hypothetical protein